MVSFDLPAHEPIFHRLRGAMPFRDVEGWELGNGFQRPVALGTWTLDALAAPVTRRDLSTSRSLLANRLLWNGYIGIDVNHRRMALEKLITPSIEKYGNEVLHDVIRGIESARLLGELADEDMLAQIAFLDSLGAVEDRQSGGDSDSQMLSGTDRFLVPPTIADALTRIRIERGVVEVAGGYVAPKRFEAGSTFLVPRDRLFGVRAVATKSRSSRRPPKHGCGKKSDSSSSAAITS